MTKITFDHCVIHVGDWERAMAFYRDVLEAEIVPYGRGYVFRFGGFQRSPLRHSSSRALTCARQRWKASTAAAPFRHDPTSRSGIARSPSRPVDLQLVPSPRIQETCAGIR
jgi:catechol 2,3-dioxygenase-like lactoylglutathione lyase family enzyme